MFSKFEFREGEYDKMDITSRAGMSTTVDYVAVVALSSLRLTDEELAKLAMDSEYAKEKSNWQRLKFVP